MAAELARERAARERAVADALVAADAEIAALRDDVRAFIRTRLWPLEPDEADNAIRLPGRG